jgi:predicted metal-dependent hydrolase
LCHASHGSKRSRQHPLAVAFPKRRIWLNLELAKKPPECLEYVLVHELVHTTQKNHSKKFWKDLEKIFPGAKLADRELKQFRIDIY